MIEGLRTERKLWGEELAQQGSFLIWSVRNLLLATILGKVMCFFLLSAKGFTKSHYSHLCCRVLKSPLKFTGFTTAIECLLSQPLVILALKKCLMM